MHIKAYDLVVFLTSMLWHGTKNLQSSNSLKKYRDDYGVHYTQTVQISYELLEIL